ncbi:hypothetical protein [Pedobacter frigoris]|uniref:DUF2116 family Zn-ribbon domain-containing protein n=1 Tax=Pedobacter frigoris TaxID=2571272 RepID=A0A4U1CI03_9SPHI|nr:hypothetical protein [Pedobacter frigoris]TKC04267.1 hypothetical protein FA047_16880 [Pedobacter frigoris]
MEKLKACFFCSRSIKGRSDKRFCNDLCRSSYNYGIRRRTSMLLISHINCTLTRNRRILDKLITAGHAQVSKEVLLSDGFDFEHYTSVVSESFNTYCFCYDLGYQIIGEEQILLIKKEELSGLNS